MKGPKNGAFHILFFAKKTRHIMRSNHALYRHRTKERVWTTGTITPHIFVFAFQTFTIIFRKPKKPRGRISIQGRRYYIVHNETYKGELWTLILEDLRSKSQRKTERRFNFCIGQINMICDLTCRRLTTTKLVNTSYSRSADQDSLPIGKFVLLNISTVMTIHISRITPLLC